jgi:HEAT repeat protein
VDPVAQKEANEAAAARKRAIQAENKERIARGEEPIRPPVPRNAIDDRVDRLRLIAVSKDEDPNVRVRAGVELKSLGSERINEEVVEGVAPLLGSSPDASIRRRLCDALKGQTGPKAREGLLLRLIGDVDPLVRTAAADSLVSLRHDPEVRRTLETAKERDASELVRAAADRSLGR